MERPENGIYIVLGEINLVVTAMKRNSRWTSHTHLEYESDPLLSSFTQLKDVLNSITELAELTPNEFLGAFLDVIRSEDTTGPITGLALTSVNKFLSYGLIDENCETAAAAIENIADAVTHARFVGTDPSSDEVVLMKILHVLRTLMLTPAGSMLTNESVCEIMQSCFRICFEMRLSELLRKSAEHTLMDMVQLLFTRLPNFMEDPKWASSLKKLKMKTGGMDAARKIRKKSPKTKHKKVVQQILPDDDNTSNEQAETSDVPQDTETADPAQTDAETSGEVYIEKASDDASGTLTAEADCVSRADTITPSEEQSLSVEPVIATTPVAGNRSIVDIQQGFQEANEKEKLSLNISPPLTPHTISMAPDSDGKMHLIADDQDNQTEQDLSGLEGTEDGTNLTENEATEKVKDETLELRLSEEVSKCESDVERVHSETEVEVGLHVEPQSPGSKEYINQQGVRFMPHHSHTHGPLVPYGLPCVRELFRFLVSLTNPVDRHNTDVMIHMGLSLLTVALESAADHISRYSSLMCLVRDDMCKNMFFLLQSDRLSLFAASVRACFLLFESMRSHLKFQLEMYFTKLMEIITSDSIRISLEQREMALESVVQLLRIPGLVTELYMNYDCDFYCTNLFEDLMKLLSKNAFPVSGIYTTHLLSLDALLAVTDAIEQHCHHRILLYSNEANKDSTGSSSMEAKAEDVLPQESHMPPAPPASGFTVAKQMTKTSAPGATADTATNVNTKRGHKDKSHQKKPRIKPNRMKVVCDMPSSEKLAQIKYTKKLYHTGTEQFNIKPSKGIAFLQEHNLLKTPLDQDELVKFLRENPKLDKKQIGEYVSTKKNGAVMDAFMRSFNFEDTRVDEALRMFLETFRLPGEAPVISYIIEHFADHWHKTAGEPFANTDAAFTLTYAIIMLNVDQHNTNAKKQNKPMTSAEFKKNLKDCNGGKNFDHDMLEELYLAIASDEMVMPSEQAGIVRENYLWKVLLKRGGANEGRFTHVPTGYYDRDLFAIVWGPTVAALSFVFDKSLEESIVQKAISGFGKCAMISAHYGMSDVFDNLVISLCKFTTLLSASETAENIPIQFGLNVKAKLSARTVFGLAHRHGDILREGWKNILDCMLQLYKGKLLPEVLITVEDFLDPSGRISLIKEEKQTIPRNDSGVFSSFYSYFSLADTPVQRGPTPEEQEAIRQAEACILDCHIEQLIQESKFLRVDSLQELLKALIFASRPENQESSNGNGACDEESAILFFEILVKVVLQNRDRVGPFWQSIQDHIYELVMDSDQHSGFLVERAVTGLLRVAIRLLRREDIAPQVLSSLRVLLTMKPNVVHSVCKQISYGIHDLLKTNAANIHSAQDWYTLFTLLEVAGAGVNPPPIMQVKTGINVSEVISEAGAQSDSEVSSQQNTPMLPPVELEQREYQSDSELYDAQSKAKLQEESSSKPLPSAGSWQMVSEAAVNRDDVTPDSQKQPPSQQHVTNQFTITLNGELSHHGDNKALMKSCETLAFLVRDAAHITPHNFESCVHCLRTFVEASIDGGQQAKQQKKAHHIQQQQRQQQQKKRFSKKRNMKKSNSSPSHIHMSDSDEEEQHDSYHSLSIQLLDLMHTLHTRAANIYSSWAEEERSSGESQQQQQENQLRREAVKQESTAYMEPPVQAEASSLWLKCWCPLLQGIARLCCDTRRRVRSQALTYLQRALLVHDLQTLSPAEWENCFNKVLFPLLHLLLENNNIDDPGGIEETRMRASTLLCKVFLQHLTPLLSLPTFTALWLTILEFMDKYMHADKSDLLCEAVPESLKNMLLVMHTAGILSTSADESQLWKLTWDRIDTFLPTLREEVFKPHEIGIEPGRNVIEREPTRVCDSEQHESTSPVSGSPTQQQYPRPPGTGSHTYSRDSSSPALSVSPPRQNIHSSPQGGAPVPGMAYTVLARTETELSPGHSPPQRAGSPLLSGQRAGSPLLPGHHPGPGTGQYVLHPPLPQMASPDQAGTLPIILNREIMQGTAPIPIIHTQGTPERKPEMQTAQHSVVREY